MVDGIIFLYGFFIYAFIVVTRTKLDSRFSIILSLIIANVMHMEYISNFSNFGNILLYEAIISVVSFLLLALTFRLSKINLKWSLYIIEIVVAVILTAMYYFLGNFLLVR